MFQSTLGPADPLIGGAGFSGDTAEASTSLLRISPQEPAAVQGRRKGLDGGARGLDVVGIGIGVAGAGRSGFRVRAWL